MRPLFPFNVISCSSLVVLLVSLVTVTSFNWNDDRNGEIKWSPDCDFYGSNIVRSTTTDAGCRDACWESSECTHFSWSSGTCYLKRFNFPAIVEDIVGRICGWINTNKRPKTSGDKPVIHDAKRNIGTTSRFWDCCKPSCAWRGKGPVNPVRNCAKDGSSVIGFDERSSCDGGSSYACNNQSPWAVNDTLSYGFAALNGADGTSACCKCYKLDFTSGSVVSKTMIVQVLNNGEDFGETHFNLQIPGGGAGSNNGGCVLQWGAPTDGWGDRFGGVRRIDECSLLPVPLQEGCQWRFAWFRNADNPRVKFQEVSCPTELTERTGCTV